MHKPRVGLLNGWFEAGCHERTTFSTYHDIQGGVCSWCKRTEAELVKAGAVWIVKPSPAPPEARAARLTLRLSIRACVSSVFSSIWSR